MKGALVPRLVPQYEEVIEEAGCETRVPGWTGYGHGLFRDVWMPPNKDGEVRCLYCRLKKPSSPETESSARPTRALSVRQSLDASDASSSKQQKRSQGGLWLPGSSG